MTGIINTNDGHDKHFNDRHDKTVTSCVQAPRPNSGANGVGFKMMGWVRIWGNTFNPGYALVPINKTILTEHPVTPSILVADHCGCVWLAGP